MSIADRVVVMREGEIVQVGTPLELYRQPVSSWLADFVSTQPINLFQAHVDHTGRAVLLPETLIVPDGVGLPAGTSFTAGVRPEHLSLHPSVSAPWQVLTQEMLGSLIKYVLQDVHGNEVTAVSTTDAAVDPGATVALHVDAPRCLTFDRESGQALTASLDGVPVVS